MDNKYYRMKIVPNDGREFKYNSEWDDLRFKQNKTDNDEMAKL